MSDPNTKHLLNMGRLAGTKEHELLRAIELSGLFDVDELEIVSTHVIDSVTVKGKRIGEEDATSELRRLLERQTDRRQIAAIADFADVNPYIVAEELVALKMVVDRLGEAQEIIDKIKNIVS